MAFLGCLGLATSAGARDHWTEINIGPYYVDTDGDSARARDTVTRLEQIRWVLGNLLEEKDLQPRWPIRILLTNSVQTRPACTFIPQNPSDTKNGGGRRGTLGFVSRRSDVQFPWQNAAVLHAQYLVVCGPHDPLPVQSIVGLFLDANTARLPADVETGLGQLFETLEAKGSRVTWGGAPAHPDLAWARMHLFATKFDYSASFHVLFAALKGGSSLRSAEQNAFGKPAAELEKEAADHLAAHDWQPVTFGGRPLDPRRDFGEHSVSAAVEGVYIADAQLATDKKTAEAAYKTAIEAGGPAAALGYEGLAQVAQFEGTDPGTYLDNAARANSTSAPVYVASAEDLPTERMLQLLKRAASLNPRWAEPVFRQAKESEDPLEQEALIKKATQIDPREPQYWIELAKAQIADGHASVAQGSWLRAEDSAPSEAERDRIHQLRLGNEAERLDGIEKARRQERDAARLADQHAQASEAERIRAAEEKANRALDAEAGEARPTEVIPWKQMASSKRLDGSIVRADCVGNDARILLKTGKGPALTLLLKEVAKAGLTCGNQPVPVRVTVTYSGERDEKLGTDGTILTMATRSRP